MDTLIYDNYSEQKRKTKQDSVSLHEYNCIHKKILKAKLQWAHMSSFIKKETTKHIIVEITTFQ